MRQYEVSGLCRASFLAHWWQVPWCILVLFWELASDIEVRRLSARG